MFLTTAARYTGIALNAALWGVYGVVVREFVPLVVSSAIGLAASVASFAIFAAVGSGLQRREVLRASMALASLTLVDLYLAWDVVVAGVPVPDELQDQFGYASWLAQLSSFMMYGFPLGTILTIVRSGSCDSIDAKVSSMSLLNAMLFLWYGMLIGDIAVIRTGCMGTLFSGAQASLLLIYPRTPQRKLRESIAPSPVGSPTRPIS